MSVELFTTDINANWVRKEELVKIQKGVANANPLF